MVFLSVYGLVIKGRPLRPSQCGSLRTITGSTERQLLQVMVSVPSPWIVRAPG